MSYACPPILFLGFRRPRETALSFASIRSAQPRQLFIALDGPREGNIDDIKRVEDVKAIVERVDWECEVKTLYRVNNLGLELAVSSALDWFFAQVESGIIIEDDCVLDGSFYPYAALMLERYRDDNNIMVVNASNFLPSRYHSPNNYYLSQYPHFWGWATWKRAWQLYDGTLSDWSDPTTKAAFESYYHTKWDRIYFENIFDNTYLRRTNSWGYRWLYSVWKNKGICITPGVNLSTNVGFNKEATHPVIRKFELERVAITPNPQLLGNGVNLEYDQLTAKKYYGISPLMIAAQKLFYWFKTVYAKLTSQN